MTIRTFQPGDDIAQVSIYNEAAAGLPKFKSATIDEVRRRLRGPDFDPGARFYAVEGTQVAGYATFQANGRVSYPWCRKGKEHLALPLLERVLEAMKQRGLTTAWAAYRKDWTAQGEFFVAQGFPLKREMQNYHLDLIEMPTPAARVTTAITALTAADIRIFKELAGDVLRAPLPELEKALLRNPWFPPTDLFCLRSRSDAAKPVAAGAFICNSTFADPNQVDASMPCFRLGAFGTEGLTTKRINGLFSFVVTEPRDTNMHGLDLLGHAARLMQEGKDETVAAQVSSDLPHMVRFYRQYFRPQGSFPIFERSLQ